MKYKVGDKVRIRRDLVVNEVYGNLHMCDNMKEELCEKCVTVQEYTKDNNYIIKESCYIISDEMIEGLVYELDNCENKINEEQLTVYDIDFTKLKHGDAIYISNKDEYNYCINELDSLGYIWQYRNGLNTFTAYTGDNPILLIIRINKTVSYMNILTNNYNDCGELNILNKIINESNKSILDKVNFNNLKENDAIICGNKENYDYVVDELYELGYKFYNVDKNYAYGKYENNVVIFIDTHDRLDYADIDYLYNDYEEEYDLKLSDITIIDLREKNIKNIEDNSIKCSRIITNTQNSKLKNPNKNDVLFSINNQINNIINMWSIKDGNYDIETYNKQLDIVERLLDIKERL